MAKGYLWKIQFTDFANILFLKLTLIPLSERLTIDTRNVTKIYNEGGEFMGKFWTIS